MIKRMLGTSLMLKREGQWFSFVMKKNLRILKSLLWTIRITWLYWGQLNIKLFIILWIYILRRCIWDMKTFSIGHPGELCYNFLMGEVVKFYIILSRRDILMEELWKVHVADNWMMLQLNNTHGYGTIAKTHF